MADGTDSTGQTPTDLDTTDQSSTDSPDLFDQITSNVATLAGAGSNFVRSLNSPAPNNVPSNVPSTTPTAPASKTSTFAGWSTTKKIVAGAIAGVVVILGLFGLKELFSRRG